MNLTGQPIHQKPEKCRVTAAAHRRHVKAVKSLPCAVCGAAGPSDAHHVYHGRFGNEKPCDCFTIPLCKSCHQWSPTSVHKDKAGWAERHGCDYEYLPGVRALTGGPS